MDHLPLPGDPSRDNLSHRLESVLASSGVPARVLSVFHGSAVIRFDLEMEEGSSWNGKAALEMNIALCLFVTPVRIEPPYPGKRRFVVEIPNRAFTAVPLHEILSSEQMKSSCSVVTVALGKDTTGNPVVYDLARRSFLLITGLDGSGKTMCVHSIINSLLLQTAPGNVHLLLLNPNGKELQCYNGAPHLLAPVLCDPRSAADSLGRIVAEMEKRSEMFNAEEAYGIKEYNQKMLRSGGRLLSRIVIVIDDLDDLVSVYSSHDQDLLVKLLHYAHWTGIHPVLVTRSYYRLRILRLIKGTHHDRITFRMAQSEDNRGVLSNGAEYLLGRGDMLFALSSPFFPVRIQGCYVSEQDIKRNVARLRYMYPQDP